MCVIDTIYIYISHGGGVVLENKHTADNDYATSTTTASAIIQIILGNIKFNVYCSRTNRRLDRLLITGSWHCTLLTNTAKVYGKNAHGTRAKDVRRVGGR